MTPSKPPMGINVASDTKAGLRFADMIVDGHKTLESRNSDTLRPYVGKRVAIVRTGEGKAKAIGEVTIGEPKVVNQKQFRAMEDEHRVPKGSRFDINTPTKHLYPMHDPVRYEEERDVGHGIVSRQVIHKAGGGTVEPTVSQMLQALAKGGKVEVRPTVKDENLMRKIPQMEAAAKKVEEGKMSHEAYDKVVAKHKPVKPYEFVPQPASDEDADRALMENKKPHWRGHEDWPAGRKVGLRLDIPAYENHGVWVNSIHDEEGKGDDKRNTSYGSVSSVKNATFDAGPTKAIKVATGEQNKSPFARIKGELHHMSEDEAVAHMQKNLNHKDYVQVGMDPRRHGYFYDRKTMKPVTHSKHVVQIGPLVLAHKPTYGERESYAKGGNVNPTQHEMRQALIRKANGGVVRLAGGGILQDVIKPDVLAKKPNQLKGVVLSGASWLAGDEKTRLAREAFGQDVTNTAVGGQKTADVLNQLNVFERDGGTFAPNTTVVLDVGANDIATGIDPSITRANLDELVSRLDNYGVKVILSGQPLANSFQEAIDNPNLVMNEMYSDIASNNPNVTLVDAMSGMLNQKNLMDESGFHLNSDEAKLSYLNQFANAYRNTNPINQIGTVIPDQTAQITETENIVNTPQVVAPLTQVEKPPEVYTPEAQIDFTPNAQVTSTPEVVASQPSAGYSYAEQNQGLGNYYQTINDYLSQDRSQDDIQSAMQQYGVSQADVDAARGYGASKLGESYETAQYAEGGAVEPTQDQMREALRQKMRNGMYSPLERLAVDIPRNKGTGAEFMAEISKRPGFKPEEVADRKIPIPEGKMTKLEFLKHLRQHSNPPLKEHMLQDLGDMDEARDDRANDYYGDDYDNISPEQRLDVKDWVKSNAAKYEKYQIPGGENYREMLLKLPALDPQDQRMIDYLQTEKRRINPPDWARSEESKRLDALMEKAKKFDTPYVTGHWAQHPNTLAHLRLSDRYAPNGLKLLHVEELQSDWHQQGRQRGYQKSNDEMQLERQRVKDEHEARIKSESKFLSDQYKALKEKMRSMTDPFPADTAMYQRFESDILRQLTALSETEPPPEPKNTGLPNAPFKKSWHELGMKHVLHHAAQNNYHGVVITSGIDQARRWGDEGLKVHYDKKIPEFLNKFGKPFGVQMQPHSYRVTGQPEDYGDASERLGLADIPMQNLTLDQNRRIANEADNHLHYFPFTPQMRENILKQGMPQYMRGGVVHKAEGGTVLPIEQIKAQMMNRFKGLNQLQSIGANEAPSMGIKAYVPTTGSPDAGHMPVGGIDTSRGDLPVGGVDMDKMQQGHQLMPNAPAPAGQQQGMNQPPMGDMPPPMGGMPPPQGGSNILSMTPQGQAMAAMKPQGLAKGGSAKSTADMKAELAAKKSIADGTSTRVKIDAEGAGGVKGIVVPRHMWEGKTYKGEGGKKVDGMRDVNEARAKVYGSERRDPMSSGQMNSLHKKILAEHFQKPLNEQTKAEEEALEKLREAKHIGKTANTLDKSEKLDTVNHEEDSAGRNYVGFASKGVAGHSLYTSGHGEDQKHHVINTCAGQTVGCGGGTDQNGIVDTSRGTCFAPNAESQYVNAAVRRASHEQAKHDPAMSKDWILAHTGSLRNAAENADKKDKVLLFRPNVVDETDVTSRHAIRHLNDQRKATNKPSIEANSYGKTNELHDPENGYHVTHSNVGPKVKKGQEITENIARDKARVRNTVMAADNKGDFKNEQGNKTPPKGSYLVTDVKRGSEMSKNMEKHISHAKYWTTGRTQSELTPEEISQGEEAHYGGNHKPTTEEDAHYGHKTVKGMRFDYQKQHVLHPRLVQVGFNDDGSKHMIPTDSRFKDTEFLPENRYKTKNGKEAGHILMTTPTESTSHVGHQTSFTHNVNEDHIEHAKKNKGEYVIDKPEDQIKSAGKEYAAPQAIKFYADGGTVGGRHIGFSDDDFHAFPEQNVIAQRHLAMRGHDKEPIAKHGLSNHKHKVTMNNDMDTMLLELTRNKKAK